VKLLREDPTTPDWILDKLVGWEDLAVTERDKVCRQLEAAKRKHREEDDPEASRAQLLGTPSPFKGTKRPPRKLPTGRGKQPRVGGGGCDGGWDKIGGRGVGNSGVGVRGAGAAGAGGAEDGGSGAGEPAGGGAASRGAASGGGEASGIGGTYERVY